MNKIFRLVLLWIGLNLLSGLAAGVIAIPFKGIAGLREHALFLIKLLLGGGLLYYLVRVEGAAFTKNILSGFRGEGLGIIVKSFKFGGLYVLVFAGLVTIAGVSWHAASLFRDVAANPIAGVLKPGVDFERLNALRGSAFGGAWLYFFGVCVLAPLIEEIFYRGLLYTEMRKSYAVLPSVVAVGVFFGFFHPNILLSAIDGFFLCYVYEKGRSLQVNIVVHSLLNMFSILVIWAVQPISSGMWPGLWF